MRETSVDMQYLGAGLDNVCLPRPGGVYVSGDGRRPLQVAVRISENARIWLRERVTREFPEAKENEDATTQGTSVSDSPYVPLPKRLLREEATLHSYEIRTCLEHLCSICATKDYEQIPMAVGAVREIFDGVVKELENFPLHPRLFRYREFFPSQGASELFDPASSLLVNSQNVPEGLVDGQEDLSARTISLRDVKSAFYGVADAALTADGCPNISVSMSFLTHAVEDATAKLAMLTGDGYERIPGTRLFTRYEKAISRVIIEHALLTSSPEELLETVKVGAVMVAIGGGVLSPAQLRNLNVKADHNSFGMEYDRQIQSGLRILKLVRQLSVSDTNLADVLRAYNCTHFTVPGALPELVQLCATVWDHKDVLMRPFWEAKDERCELLQSCLSSIISNAATPRF